MYYSCLIDLYDNDKEKGHISCKVDLVDLEDGGTEAKNQSSNDDLDCLKEKGDKVKIQLVQKTPSQNAFFRIWTSNM